MGARGHVEIGTPACAPASALSGICPGFPHVHRRHQGDVRQVRPAAKGIVQHDHVAGPERKLSMAARTDIGIEPRCTGM